MRYNQMVIKHLNNLFLSEHYTRHIKEIEGEASTSLP